MTALEIVPLVVPGPRPQVGGRGRVREIDWPELTRRAPVLAGTMTRYLDQIALSLRPASVRSADGMLRRFAGYITTNHPDIRGLVEVERIHIEGFKRHLASLPGRSGGLSPATIRMTLGTLRTFFERVSEWDYPDAPTRVLIFNGDLPTPDAPLPKFLSDVEAGKFMRAAAQADPIRRLVVEVLARTGLRVSELCNLEAGAVSFRDGRHWLLVPVGKLHTDRGIPLHAQLVEQLEAHQASRADNIDRLIVVDGRPVSRDQVARMVVRVAKAAGIGHVHPHQLRHTLATQAINRGMSLEAIAEMLGHKTLRMTMVYARIADRTVSDAYDQVIDRVDALYAKPNGLRADGTGSAAMGPLGDDVDQRMLANGHCNRPVQLDCQFESICESCAHYSTNASFNPVLEAQRDHASARDQHHRVDLFQMLIDRNQKAAP